MTVTIAGHGRELDEPRLRIAKKATDALDAAVACRVHEARWRDGEMEEDMGKMDSTWHPAWWKDEIHGAAWGLVSESMHRDWEQTKHDLGMGGYELHQGVGDTLKQACGAEPLPNPGEASPSAWSEAQALYGYGFAARREFGLQHPQWSRQLEAKLKSDWMAGHERATRSWKSVVHVVRRGYEFADATKAPGSAPSQALRAHASGANAGR